MLAMDSDRANRVGHRIAEIVHVDPDRDPGAPFADRLEDRQAVTRLAPSRMSKPSTLGGAHSVTVIVPSEGSPKRDLRRRATEPRPSEPSAFSSMCGSPVAVTSGSGGHGSLSASRRASHAGRWDSVFGLVVRSWSGAPAPSRAVRASVECRSD